MKCPYCGAEVYGRYCEYCDSEVNPDADEPRRGSGNKKPLYFYTIIELCNQFLEIKEVTENVYASMLMSSNGERILKGHSIHPRLLKVLDIPEDDSIYLIHDDTMMHSGKNGFAITSSGFYCQSGMSKVVYTSWEQFKNACNVTRDPFGVRADGQEVAYITDSDAIKDALYRLFKQIQEMFLAYGERIFKVYED